LATVDEREGRKLLQSVRKTVNFCLFDCALVSIRYVPIFKKPRTQRNADEFIMKFFNQ
jgi:hypothetical protein